MAVRHAAVLALVLTGLVASTLVLAPPAKAADVSFRLVAANFEWHRNNPTTPAAPTLTANAGDRLLFTVENQDIADHTFTFPHFGVDVPLAAAPSVSNPTVIFVNITTTAADVGRWQFWCAPHSSGSDPENRTGMVGWVQLAGLADTTPPTIVHTPPTGTFRVGDAIPLAANVTDDVAVTAVRVNYTDVAGQSSNVSMTVSGGEYVFTVPAQAETGTVTYLLYATDAAGNVATAGPFTVTVAEAPTPTPTQDYALWIILGVVIVVLAVGLLLWRRSKAPKPPGT